MALSTLQQATAALRRGHARQRAISRISGWLWIPLVAGALRFGMGYRIRELPQVRARFRRLRRESGGPLLLCANHLTLIDSLLVGWALASPGRYLWAFRDLPWNLPEARNFAATPWARAASYLTKCIPILRGGRRQEVAAVLRRVTHLLSRGETALLFPEGGRSRSGRVDVEQAAWGVGRIVGSLPDVRVLCVYLRGDRQQSWGQLPARGERFHVELVCIEPKSKQRGARRSRDLARQVVGQLAQMEEAYFDGR